MKRLLFLSLCLCLQLGAWAQADDAILFTVDNVPVTAGEFKYIYTKTNGAKADFSKASVNEYLDLYTKFKLKVRRAKELQMDTISSLKMELDNYRRQLADSYLVDKEVTDKLIEQAYARSQKDRNISHILVNLKGMNSPTDTAAAFQKISDIAAKAKSSNFEELAKQYSEDTVTRPKGGNIGFVNAMLANGYYQLESAIYDTPVGGISPIVRTPQGYHIVKVNSERPARGEMEISHILIRKDKKDPNSALPKARIDSIYMALQGGADFAALARQLSQDKSTGSKGGYVGFMGINLYESNFEDAVFALAKDNDYSRPIESSVGWHIVKRLSQRGIEPFDKAKPRLKTKITQDSRFDAARYAMVERIKKEANYQPEKATLQQFINNTDSTFLTYKWQIPTAETPDTKTLFRLGGIAYSMNDFYEFLKKNSRKRINMGSNNMERAAATNILYDEFVAEASLKHEEQNLEKKYPEFKSLLREYEEGILLFEVTKANVWDKASQDTVGLAAFYPNVREKYRWDERAVLSYYTLQGQDTMLLEKVRALAAKKPSDKVLKKFNKKNKNILTVQEKTFEKGKNEALNKMKWQVGELSYNETNKQAGTVSFMKIEKLLPPTTKTLNEARGYIVADYQDHLEREWVTSLQKAYPVKVNQNTLNAMIK